jgi:hypothetical protein
MPIDDINSLETNVPVGSPDSHRSESAAEAQAGRAKVVEKLGVRMSYALLWSIVTSLVTTTAAATAVAVNMHARQTAVNDAATVRMNGIDDQIKEMKASEDRMWTEIGKKADKH